jgi:hypothetical protein
MKISDALVGVYDYFNESYVKENSLSGAKGASFYFLYLLDKTGLLNRDELASVYQEVLGVELKSHYVGPFENLESLNQFAFNLCQKKDAEKIYILSAEEYNQIIENSVNDVSTFSQAIMAKANCLENIDHRKKGFLGKLFN